MEQPWRYCWRRTLPGTASGALPRMCGLGIRRTSRRCPGHFIHCLVACSYIPGVRSHCHPHLHPSALRLSWMGACRPSLYDPQLYSFMCINILWKFRGPSIKALLPQGMGVLMVGRTEAAASAAVLALQRALPASCHGCFLAFKVCLLGFHTRLTPQHPEPSVNRLPHVD